MEQINLVSSKIEFTLDGKAYKLRLPTYKEQIEYRKEQQLAGDDEIKIYESVIGFLDKLGFPKSDSELVESGILFKIVELVATKKI